MGSTRAAGRRTALTVGCVVSPPSIHQGLLLPWTQPPIQVTLHLLPLLPQVSVHVEHGGVAVVAPEEDGDSEAVAVVVPAVRLVVGAAGCDQGLVDHAARDHRRAEVARSAGLGDSHVVDDVAVAANDVLLGAPAAVGDHLVHDALGPGASGLAALLASLLRLRDCVDGAAWAG